MKIDDRTQSKGAVSRISEGSKSVTNASRLTVQDLKLSDSQLAKIKSPVYMKLENMIDTLAKFRNEMQNSRVPTFEVEY